MLTVPGGKCRLVMQSDGNLVEYAVVTGRPVWASMTFTTGSSLTLQSDGNLVLYSGSGQPLWQTCTYGTNANRLAMQDDGNVVPVQDEQPD